MISLNYLHKSLVGFWCWHLQLGDPGMPLSIPRVLFRCFRCFVRQFRYTRLPLPLCLFCCYHTALYVGVHPRHAGAAWHRLTCSPAPWTPRVVFGACGCTGQNAKVSRSEGSAFDCWEPRANEKLFLLSHSIPPTHPGTPVRCTFCGFPKDDPV